MWASELDERFIIQCVFHRLNDVQSTFTENWNIQTLAVFYKHNWLIITDFTLFTIQADLLSHVNLLLEIYSLAV